MLRSSNVLVAFVTGCTVVVLGACGGDTVESDGNGGSGGQVLDSGNADVTSDADVTPESGSEAGSEAGPDAEADGAPDTSVDAPLDQSVEAEASVIDGEAIEGSLFDVTMPDVILNDGATLQGCYDCAVDSCSTEMATCQDDDKCRTILLCLFEDQCFGGANGIDFACGMSCAMKAGITSASDPSVSIALDAGQCIAGSCQEDCGLDPDGGLPFDASLDGF